MFPGNGVQRGLRYIFSLVWWVCQKCQANQQQHVYKPRGIKETARTMGPSEDVYKCVRCSSVYVTIEDIRRHVCRKSFIVTSYQHDDDEFVSKCN